MHGIIRPIDGAHDSVSVSWQEKLLNWGKRHRLFLFLVIVPTIIVAIYYYAFASDQYSSDTHFVVRSSQTPSPSASGLGALLGFGGALNQSKTDAMSVIDYLSSTEAVAELDRRIGLVKRFQQGDADFISRLRPESPTPEALLKYYRKQVKINYNEESGITEVSVHSFSPADSYQIAQQLLKMGEERVNKLNIRSYQDALTTSSRQLAEAESAMTAIQVNMTSFRRRNSDIDPEGSGKAQTGLVTQLTGALAAARAQLQAMRGVISPSSPQYIAQAARVRGLEAQVTGQAGRLAGNGSTIANRLGDYEALRVQQDFAARRYEAAAAAYQSAREDARKKRLYLVPIVNPNLPVKPLFPERGRIVLTVFASLLAAYAITWLLIAGVREHEA